MNRIFVALATLAVFTAGCSQGGDDSGPAPYASRYEALPSVATLLTGATILTGTGTRLENADILLGDGKIIEVGQGLSADGAEVVDAAGKWITPGVIDVHSHLGVYPSPGTRSHSDGNESIAPVTAEVWAEHSVWPHDPGFVTALAGGVTSMQILPGSANLIGGRSVTVKNVPGRNVMEMKFPGAPHGMKMACGENPKRVYGGRKQAPSTRMGNVAGYRSAWIEAADYRDKMAAAEKGQGEAPIRSLRLDTLVGVLNGEILVHNHCYRGDEMSVMLDIAKEFGYKVTAFHHAVEAYKVADLLAEADRPAFRSFDGRQITRRHRTILSDLLQYCAEIFVDVWQFADRAVLPRLVARPPVRQQRPSTRGNYRCLVRPLLGEVTGPVDILVEPFAIVRPDARPHHEVMCRDQDIDIVKLQQPQKAQNATKMPDIRATRRSLAIQPLCRQRNAACLGRGHAYTAHYNDAAAR